MTISVLMFLLVVVGILNWPIIKIYSRTKSEVF